MYISLAFTIYCRFISNSEIINILERINRNQESFISTSVNFS